VNHTNHGDKTVSFNMLDWKIQSPTGDVQNNVFSGSGDLGSGQLIKDGKKSGSVCFSPIQGSGAFVFEGLIRSLPDPRGCEGRGPLLPCGDSPGPTPLTTSHILKERAAMTLIISKQYEFVIGVDTHAATRRARGARLVRRKRGPTWAPLPSPTVRGSLSLTCIGWPRDPEGVR